MNENLRALFEAGALSALEDAGFSEKQASDAMPSIFKAAARVPYEDDENDTWWGRNKNWVLPTAIGAGAFLIGADAGRNGRPDKSYLSNAGSLLWERVKALLGVPNSALWRATTEAKEY